MCEKLEEVYGLCCSAKDVLNLDSSTSEKFSRHLIFMLPSVAFKDNSHVGESLSHHQHVLRVITWWLMQIYLLQSVIVMCVCVHVRRAIYS